MSLTRYLIGAVALAGALALSSCGGGSAGMADRQAGQGVAIGEPNPSAAPVTADFIAQAQAANCADQRNRLFVIDKKMVFWDRAGNCPDNSYARTLYGATPQALLCSVSDSIAGPRTSCVDTQSRALFDIIIANLDKSDLGLGSSHQVEALAVPPKSASALPFISLDQTTRSGIQSAQTVTIRDADSFRQMWAAHSSGALPAVDFSRKMVLGVFLGVQPNGCYATEIASVDRGADKVTVRHTDSVPGPAVLCTMALTTPAHLVVVERSELPVEFTEQKQIIG
jgi:hypothetical protein